MKKITSDRFLFGDRIIKKLFGCLCLALCGLLTTPAMAEEVKATPYRPTVSKPAYLPVANYVEIEMGWQSLKAKQADAHRHSIPYLLKYAFTERIGVLIGGKVAVIKDQENVPTQSGFGNMSGILKVMHPLDTPLPSAIGFEGGIKFPSAPNSIATDHTDFLVNGIYSMAYAMGSME